jgi:hypothetical protein
MHINNNRQAFPKEAPYNFPESRYINNIDIDFEGLPGYIVQKGIVWKFEVAEFHNDNEYNQWQADLLNFYKTIPEQYIYLTVVKGIEYANKAYQFHKDNECRTPYNCRHNESWERRLAIMLQILNAINKNTTDKEIHSEAEDVKNGDFTTARQVLAIHYLLEYCQVKNVDNTTKARFIQFLTGKETGAKDIKNTTIYKRVAKPFSTDNKTLNADLAYIRGYFEKMGLSEIAKMITNEISQSEK